MPRQRYVPDLQEMASVAESNYMRFLRLLPETDAGGERVFAIAGHSGGNPEHSARIRIRVEEVQPYTTMLTVKQEGLAPEWVQLPSMQVRLYHDVSMAEVMSYQNQHRFEGRYQYPNPQMRMPDEKIQLNRFLADWLDHCLQHGLVEKPFSFIPTL
ncbi:MAG: DUF1249 domain-containing protein [Thalassolituus sp.]